MRRHVPVTIDYLGHTVPDRFAVRYGIDVDHHIASYQASTSWRRKMALKRLIAVARGDLPADLVILNARIVNTFTGEIEEGSVAIAEGLVAGVQH